MRGSVALRPLFLSSSALVMGVRRGPARRGAPVESAHHTSLASHRRPSRVAPARHPMTSPFARRSAPPLAARRLARSPAASRCSRPTASSASSRPTRSRSSRATSSPRSRSALVKPGMTRAAGARRPRLAAADRPVPCRPLGLRLHDPAPGRRAAAAPRRRAASRATRSSSFEGDADAERARVRRLDRHLQDARATRRRSTLPTSSSRRCRRRARPPAAASRAPPAPARSYPPLEPSA